MFVFVRHRGMDRQFCKSNQPFTNRRASHKTMCKSTLIFRAYYIKNNIFNGQTKQEEY